MSKAFTSEEPVDEVIPGRVVARVARGQERPVTADGYRVLTAEVERLGQARATAGTEAERAELDHRLKLAMAAVESVRVVEVPPPDGTVRFGSEVTLEWEDGRTQVVRLVGPDEASSSSGRISIESPLARTLLEHREGDEVEVHRPRGPATVMILKVE